MKIPKHIEELSREIAGSCWCEENTKNLVMEPDLALVFATKLSLWIDDCAKAYEAIEYYRGLLVKCGLIIGPKSHICDDGSISQDVLVAKIPELVAELEVRGTSLQSNP